MDLVESEMPFPRKPSPFERFGVNAHNWQARAGGVNSRLPNALYNDTNSDIGLKAEKPVHRQIGQMLVQGYTLSETAAAVGHSLKNVSRVARQPFVRKQMIEAMQQDVSLEIKKFLEAEVLPSLKVLTEVRDDAEARASDRLAAANALLDRHMGKPSQPFTMPAGGKPVADMTEAELDDAIRQTGVIAVAAGPAGSEAPQGDPSVAG